MLKLINNKNKISIKFGTDSSFLYNMNLSELYTFYNLYFKVNIIELYI